MISERLRRLTSRNPVVVIENRVRTANGEVRWMQFVNRGFFDQAGRLVETQSVGRDITERKLAEEALRQSEERWKFALEGAGDGVWDWNVATGEALFSERWKNMLGYTAEEIGGDFEEWSSRVHPEDMPGALVAVNAHLDGATPVYASEFRMRCKDGSWKWILARGMVTARDRKGRPLRAIGTHQDISARKASDEREARYVRAIRGTNDGLWDWCIPTRELFLSPRWKEMLGFKDDELPNHEDTFFGLVHPDDVERMQEALQAHLEQHEPYDIELRLRTKSGGYRWVHSRGEVEWNEKNEATHMAGTISDITERKHVQERYAREQEFNKALVSHTSALIVVLDDESRVEHVNPAFTKQLGYELDEIAHKPLWESGLMSAAEIPRAKERYRRLSLGEDMLPVELRLRAKGGEWHILELQPTATRHADGSVDRIILTFTDMTERTRLQHEVLRISEQEQANIGHNLHDGVGQTMTGIATMLEFLESSLEGEPKKQAARIRELMQQSVAEVRRMSHGLSPLAIQQRGLIGGLQLLAETVRTNYRAAATCEIDPTIVIADPEKETHLFRIAQEAVNNALRHGSARKVLLSLQRAGATECELKISDDGTGLKAKSGGKQPGVGIRVMQYRANLIGGEIHVTNSPSGGVTIACRFPCPRQTPNTRGGARTKKATVPEPA